MRNSFIFLIALSVTGCVSIPTLRQSTPDLPAAYLTAEGPSETHLQDWWRLYNDPALTQLIEEALAHNHDLKLAAARIEETRAAYDLAQGERQPSAQLGAGVSRSRVTEKGSNPVTTPVSNKFQINAQAAYELDLWGRYRQASAAARADLLASEYARQVVRVSLADAVAQGYFQLTALDAEIALTQTTLDNRREAEDLHRLRFDAGVNSELPWRQAQAETAAVESTKAVLERQRQLQENALALLLGRSPRALLNDAIARGKTLDDLPLPPAIPAGLPSDLLKRRPDLLQAEQQLAGAEARLEKTKAAIYPSLSLTANLGSESKSLSDLFSGPATIWGLGLSLAQSLYNGHRTEATLQSDATRHEQTLLAYENTLRVAFKEVLDALINARQAQEIESAETQRSEALSRAAELAALRYQNGASNYLEVLDAHRGLHQAQQNRLEARRARLAASAGLFKALGGGWEMGR